jgi:hypothetical protein
MCSGMDIPAIAAKHPLTAPLDRPYAAEDANELAFVRLSSECLPLTPERSVYAWNAFRRGEQIEKINWDVTKQIQTPV